MTSCRTKFYNVQLVWPCVAAPTGMWSGMLMHVDNLCRNTLYSARSGV